MVGSLGATLFPAPGELLHGFAMWKGMSVSWVVVLAQSGQGARGARCLGSTTRQEHES